MTTLTIIILFFILVCLYFISNILWEIYSSRNGNKIDDRGFFSNFGVSLIYCLVVVFVIYIIVFFLKIT
jgi:hypothetical protein